MSASRSVSLDAAAAASLKPGEHMLCYACRASGRCQLGIKEVPATPETGSVLARLVCPATYEGGPSVAHGGWTAAVFDEVFGHLGPLSGHMTVTASLTVDYVKPVPIGRELEIRGRIDRIEGRRVYVEAEMTLVSTGAVLGRARGIFVIRDASHFENHRRWMAEQDRLAAEHAVDPS